MYWLKNGLFKDECEARGAFRLAHQQALDGMGTSIPEWMGLTAEQFDNWIKDGSLPSFKKT
jgi:hypothetical protein